MRELLHRYVGLIASAIAFGCSPPGAEREVDATLAEGAVVFEGTSEEEQSWGATIKITDAPAGEYLLFESFTKPTSLAALDTFNPDTCSGNCDVSNLGAYAGRVKLDATGPVTLTYFGSHQSSEYASTRYFIVTRQVGSSTASPPPSLAIRATIRIEGNGGGCGSNPDPPDVRNESLTTK